MALFRSNAIVGQSGGPTSAINATLSGIIKGAFNSGKIEKLYGMKNGIECFFNEKIIDLSYLFGNEKLLSILESTPSAYLGSTRKKLPPPSENPLPYKQIFDVLKKYNIRYIFYIGGNDSMDTVYKLSEYSKNNDYRVNVIGVPKTVDNDLVLTDHTPGYGSAAKYVAAAICEIAADRDAYTEKSVAVVEIMGRDAGWLTCAAALPKYYMQRGANLIYLPEIPFLRERFIRDIKNELSARSSVVVAISEGVKYENGEYVGAGNENADVDAFGHRYLSGCAKKLEALIKREIGCKTRSVELNLLQRCAAHISSKTDLDESLKIGEYAVKIALQGQTAKMASISRKRLDVYEIELNSVDAKDVMGKVKYVPRDFISDEGNGITRACIEYITPLILGERSIEYKNGIPVHLILK